MFAMAALGTNGQGMGDDGAQRLFDAEAANRKDGEAMTPAVVGILSLVGVVAVVCVLLAFGKAMEVRAAGSVHKYNLRKLERELRRQIEKGEGL